MNHGFKIFFLVFSVLLFSLSAQAVSLSSNGEVHSVTQGNLEFKTDGSGLVKLFKNGDYLSSFGFTLKGTVNAQQKFLNSWSTSWTWQVLSNTDSNVTVLGSTTWQGLDWKQRWFFSDTQQKFTNYLTNNTGFDVTDTSFYYVVRFDPNNVSCLHYVDNDRQGNKYCFEQDITKTQNLSQFLKRINFKETMFNFQDLIDDGFEFNYLFAGNLNNVKSSLAGQGFIIGVTKNGGLFPNGASIELDPSVIDTTELSLTNYGNTKVRDSSGNIFEVQEKIVNSFSDIFVSKSTDEGVTWTTFNLTNSPDENESLVHIDLNGENGLIIQFDGNNSEDVFITTCSTGGCDSNAEFLDKLNVSGCGATACAHGNIYHDQNGTSHISYAKGESTLHYRSNTGFVGSAWSAEEDVGSVGGGAITGRDGTGVLIANNGDGTKIVFTNANGAQANIGFFNGTLWSPSILELASVGVAEPLGGFAGYDGNFYITYSKQVSGADTSKQIHYRQCITDCNILGNWSTDLNVTAGGLNLSYVSLFQSSDLNVNIIASSLVSAADANLFHFVRTPNNIFTTSHIADGNLLFSDANRTYNPLVRNRDYDGAVVGIGNLPTGVSFFEMDYSFLTSNTSTGDPSTLLFDSNILATNSGIIADFEIIIHTENFDAETPVSLLLVDLNSVTTIIDSNVTAYSWFADGTLISNDQNVQRSFSTGSDFNISLVVDALTLDTNTVVSSQKDLNLNLKVPEITVADFNVNSELSVLDINAVGNISMRCTTGVVSADLNYTVGLNDVNVFQQVVDDNSSVHLADQNFLDGENTLVFVCKVTSGLSATRTVTFNAFIKNFFFAFDHTGVVVPNSGEYAIADINSVFVYSFDNNFVLDLFTDGEVSFNASGDQNTAIQIRIGYDDPTFPFTSRDFELKVLDVNSVPVCFSSLQTFYQNVFFSSVQKQIRLINANTGCYHFAATTKFAFADSLSISSFLVPQSYNLFILDNGGFSILAIVDGSSAGQINLDALIIKRNSALEISVPSEAATIQKGCGETDDCNTWTIRYRNAKSNNSKAVATIFNEALPLFTHTETTSPNDFSVSFDATDLNFFDANVLKLTVVATRTDASTKTFTIFFTPQGKVGFIDPAIAVILSFVIFIGGISLVSARIVFGWFGAIITLIALAFLSFSVGVWWLGFMQAIMLSMLVYIGMTFSQAQSGAT